MRDDELVRRYHAAKNKDDASLPGVPLRDLTRGDWRAYPKWLRESVDASGLWSELTAAKPDPKPTPKPATEQPAQPAKDGTK